MNAHASNFQKLREHGFDDAFNAAHEAEAVLQTGSNLKFSAISLRRFLEGVLAKSVKPKSKLPASDTFNRLIDLERHGPGRWVLTAMHNLRRAGNSAAHDKDFQIDGRDLIRLLRDAHKVQKWLIEDVGRSPEGVPDFDGSIYSLGVSRVAPREDQTSGESGRALSLEETTKEVDGSGIRFEPQSDHPVLDVGQLALARISSGKHFVNAPPGTGKTQLLTSRLEFMLETFQPQQIVCLTFTNRAAEEMSSRMKGVVGDTDIFIGNIHAFCLDYLSSTIAEEQPRFRNFTIIDEEFKLEFARDELRELMKSEDAVAGMKPLPPELGEIGNLVQDSLSALGNKLAQESQDSSRAPGTEPFLRLVMDLTIPFIILSRAVKRSLRQVAATHWNDVLSSQVASLGLTYVDPREVAILAWMLLQRLDARKQRINALDFDDLIGFGLVHLHRHQRKYQCIQVDEVQDLNQYQWALIEALSDADTTVFAVGDNEQSIYRFLGASSDLLKSYTQQFETHSMQRNYRSTAPLVKLLNSYREVNFGQEATSVAPTDLDLPNGPSTMLLSYANQQDELLGGLRAVKKVLESPGRYIGILFRYNKAVDEFATLLSGEGIPAFRVSQRDIMHHPIMLDFISLLRVHAGNATRVDWYRLAYRFSKSVNTKTTRLQASKFVDDLADLGISPQLILPATRGESRTSAFDYRARALVELERSGELIIFDTETTSADPNRASLLQIAAARIKDGRIIDEFNRFVHVSRPGEEYLRDLEASQAIHNIDLALLERKGEPVRDVLHAFTEFCGDGALLAHHLPYDLSVLSRHIGQEEDASQIDSFFQKRAKPMFDSLAIARQMYPKEPSYTLESLISRFNLEGRNSHDAMDDVRATASLTHKLVQDITKNLNGLDHVLDVNPQFADAVQQHAPAFLENLWIQDFGIGTSLTTARLSQFLRDWLTYSKQQDGWYSATTFGELETEIEEKVIRWMDRSLPTGRVCDILVAKEARALTFLSEIDLIDPEHDRVVVSTIHRAKGLAFETVLLPQAVDDTYPSFRAKKDNDLHQLEEDKRLLYVGLSRPRKKLIVTFHRTFRSYEKELSRYLRPLVGQFEYTWPKEYFKQ